MCNTIHPFEIANLGLAPFNLQDIVQKVTEHGQPAGTCDYCGNGIKNCCVIKSHDNKVFIVGIDCVKKLNRTDNKLATEVQRKVAKIARDKRDAKRAAEWKAACERRDAALQAERVANGGKTLAEIATEKRNEEIAANRGKFAEANAWLIKVLDGMSGDFCNAMYEKLHTTYASSLSDRMLSILRDIYGKSHGRSGSKAYDAATEVFDENTKSE